MNFRFSRWIALGILVALCGREFAQAAGAVRPESRAIIRILPVGDSITRGSYLRHYDQGPFAGEPVGLPSVDGGGYRKPLQDELRRAGIAFDFVGALSYDAYGKEGVLDPSFDPDHHGLAGFSNRAILDGGIVPTPRDVLAALGVDKLTVPGIVEVLAKYQPDVILLLSGANGFDAAARDLLITTIGERSHAYLFVGTVTAQKSPRIGWGNVAAYNQSLQRLVEARRRAGQRVTLVDLSGVITEQDLLPDGVHPTRFGLEKIAHSWFVALQAMRPELSARLGHTK